MVREETAPIRHRPEGGLSLRGLVFVKQVTRVAKTSPGQFINQVKTEAGKIVWPTGRETMVTAIMVIIMTSLLGLFFFGTDTFFGWVVRMLLSLAAGR